MNPTIVFAALLSLLGAANCQLVTSCEKIECHPFPPTAELAGLGPLEFVQVMGDTFKCAAQVFALPTFVRDPNIKNDGSSLVNKQGQLTTFQYSFRNDTRCQVDAFICGLNTTVSFTWNIIFYKKTNFGAAYAATVCNGDQIANFVWASNNATHFVKDFNKIKSNIQNVTRASDIVPGQDQTCQRVGKCTSWY